MDVKKWNGYRLIAIDGSTSRLPNSASIIETYGVSGTSETDTPVILSRLSQAYDMLNHITIDAQFSKYNDNEHDMALEHIPYLQKGDIALFDRNYGSFWLFGLLQSKDIYFCARLKVGSWKIAKQLADSGQKEIIAEIYPSKVSARKCKSFGLDYKKLTLRFICIELASGEKEVLVTNLMDKQEIPYGDLAKLYQQRWLVEESYKRMKSRLEIENYSGKTPLALLQDFYAKIFSCNLTSILMTETDQQIKEITKNRKHNYQLNFTQALNRMKNSVILLFVREKSKINSYLDQLRNLFLSNLEVIRFNRHYKRKFKKSKRTYPMPYKNTF